MIVFAPQIQLEFIAAKEKLEIVSGAAPPLFGFFAGGIPRRRRRRNAFGLIQKYCTALEKLMSHSAYCKARTNSDILYKTVFCIKHLINLKINIK